MFVLCPALGHPRVDTHTHMAPLKPKYNSSVARALTWLYLQLSAGQGHLEVIYFPSNENIHEWSTKSLGMSQASLSIGEH